MARSLHGSIYNANFDPTLRDHLQTLPNQIDSVNPQKVMTSLSERINYDTKSHKFMHNKRDSDYEKEFESDRKSFYMNILNKKDYKIQNLRKILVSKGLVDDREKHLSNIRPELKTICHPRRFVQ